MPLGGEALRAVMKFSHCCSLSLGPGMKRSCVAGLTFNVNEKYTLGVEGI